MPAAVANQGVGPGIRWKRFMAVAGLIAATLSGAAPALREQVSLNGVWREGGMVPTYAGENFDRKTFARIVAVPAGWEGRRIRLEFGAVNFIARVFVDDEMAGEHIGGWLPFAIDVTDKVRPGNSFELRVEVLDRTHPPITDERGKMLWPIGDSTPCAGIVDDVWLRAYGEVAIEDAHIVTSVKKGELEVTWRVRNETQSTAAIVVGGEVAKPGATRTTLSLRSAPVEITSGATQTVVVRKPWPEAELWWPDQPVLYHLESKVLANGRELDRETRRFGFREIAIEGAHFTLNGVRMNFRSDWVLFGSARHWGAQAYTPEGWAQALQDVKRMNVNLVRLHKHPAPRFAMDVADELGMCLMAESAINGANAEKFSDGFNKPAYMVNALQWVAGWVPAVRNHPSIVLWSTSNEMSVITPEDARTIEQTIRAADETRPVGSEDLTNIGVPVDIGHRTLSVHYPRRGGKWNAQPWGNDRGIYAWQEFVSPDRPTMTGECLWTPPPEEALPEQQRTIWWQGVWTRGMRYTGWAQIGPPVWRWARKEPHSLRAINLRNAFSPVAVFDRAYDELGIAPYVGAGHEFIGAWPEVDEGAWLERVLVIYNDDFRDTLVRVALTLEVDGVAMAAGEAAYEVALGEHREIPCRFQVPFSGGKTMQLRLRAFKGGQLRFEEARHFRLREAARRGVSSDRILLGATQP
jgi:hypothetical protein